MSLERLERDLERIKENSFFNNVSSTMIAMIGVCYALIGIASNFIDIPKIFIISATISSFFFVGADGMSAMKPITKLTKFSYGLCVFFGLFCIVILPAAGINYASFTELLQKQSEVLTMIGFGLVLIGINIRTDKNKEQEKELLHDIFKEYHQSVQKMEEQYKLVLDQNERLFQELKDLKKIKKKTE